MMWRLNFLVVLVCIVLQNSYMLYYICPMHTLFTIMVYAALGLGHRYNKSNAGITCKSVPCSAAHKPILSCSMFADHLQHAFDGKHLHTMCEEGKEKIRLRLVALIYPIRRSDLTGDVGTVSVSLYCCPA